MEDFVLPADKHLTLATSEAGLSPVAYVEPIAVGDLLPDVPIFLEEGYYVRAHLKPPIRTPAIISPPCSKADWRRHP